jgi:hypothetical protein
MNHHHARIAAIMSCLLGGSAFAQQTQQPAQPQPMPAPQEAGTRTQDQPAMGTNTEEAKSAARSLSDVQAEGIRLSQLDREQVMDLQRALQEAGYYTAAIDGIVGSRTKQALRQFYGDQAQLAAQGMISARGAAALGMDQAEIERVGGREPATTAKPPSGTQPQQSTQQPQQPAQQPQQPMQQPQQPAQQPQQPAQQPQPAKPKTY